MKKEAWLFPILDVLLNGFNFLAIIFISTRLTQDDFGIFSALVALASVMFIAGVSIQTLAAKAYASKEQLRHYLLPISLRGALVMNITYLIMIYWLKAFTRSGYFGLILVLVLVDVHLLTSFQRGVLQGLGRFRQLNISFYIEVLVRLIMTLILFLVSRTYESAVAALLVGISGAGLHGWFLNSRTLDDSTTWMMPKIHKVREAAIASLKEMITVIAGNGCLFFIAGIGILMVNYRLPDMSGVYGLATKFSQLILAVTMSVTTILMPMGAKRKHDRHLFRSFVRTSVKWLVMLLGILWLGYLLVLPIVLSWIYGQQAEALMALIRIQSIAYSLYGISQYLVQMNIVNNKSYHLMPLVLMAVAYTVLLNNFGTDIERVIWLEVLLHAALLFFMGIGFGLNPRSPSKYVGRLIRKEQIR